MSCSNSVVSLVSQAQVRENEPPPFECAACRAAFPLFSEWWLHFDKKGHCPAESVPEALRKEYVARPLVDWRSTKCMELLEKKVLKEMSRYFDERMAADHAMSVAEKVTHAALSGVDKGAKAEGDLLVAVFRERLSRNASKRTWCFCGSQDDSLHALSNGLESVDLRDRGYVNRGELHALFYALAANFRRVSSRATRDAREAVDAVFAFATESQGNNVVVVDYDTVLRWWSEFSTVTRGIVPSRLYRRSTPVVLAKSLLVLRAKAVAQRDEVTRFRLLRPPDRHNFAVSTNMLQAAGLDYLTEERDRAAYIAQLADYAVESVAVLLDLAAHPSKVLPQAVAAFDTARVLPSAAEHHAPSPAPPYIVEGEVNKRKEFELKSHRRRSRIVRRAWHASVIVGSRDDAETLCPTNEEQLEAERGAEDFAGARLRTASGRLALQAERHHYEAMAFFLDASSNDDEEQLLQCARIALPYDTDGRGILNSRDIGGLLQDVGLVNPNHFTALSSSKTGLVAFSAFLNYCAGKVNLSTKQSSRQSAVKAIVNRERAEARGRLWSARRLSEIHEDLKEITKCQQLLHARVRHRSAARERDVLRLRLVAAADRQSQRMLGSRQFRNYVKCDLFFVSTLAEQFASALSSCRRADALKQAEYWFKVFDIDSEGKIAAEVLGDLLRNFGVRLPSPRDELLAATEIAGSKALVEWPALRDWLSKSPYASTRLAKGWKNIGKRRLRKHARLRLRLANRHRTLAQLDLVLALERKWQCLADLATIESDVPEDFLPFQQPTKESPLEGRLRRAREMSAAHHRQRVGPFDGGSLFAPSSERHIAEGMVAHADIAIDRGLRASATFAQEYVTTRASLLRTKGGALEYDHTFSSEKAAAPKVGGSMTATFWWCLGRRRTKKKNEVLPMAWTWCFGRAHLAASF